jgi:signal transduction histidine kinase
MAPSAQTTDGTALAPREAPLRLQGAALSPGTSHVGAMLRCLVLLSCVVLGISSAPSHPVLFWLGTAAYGVVALGHVVFAARLARARVVSWLFFLLDLAALSALILLRGTEVRELLVASFTLMLLAAIVDGLGHALLNILLVTGAYVMLTRWGSSTTTLLSSGSLAHIALFAVVGGLMGHTAEEARRLTSERRTAERRRVRAQSSLRRTNRHLRVSEQQLEAAQESLRANERLVTLGMLSAGVSHELKNPIAVILAGVEAADEIASEGGAQEGCADLDEALGACRDACQHLERIVADLNNLARAGTRELASMDLAESVDVAARLLRKVAAPGIDVRVESAGPVVVPGDPGRILQVVLNLGKNALDALEDAGGGCLKLRCELTGDGGRIDVVDDGPGIAEEMQRCIFEPFVTTKGPGRGTGLGLHLVREIVTSHAGTVSCRSRVGEGTCMRIELPGHEADEETARWSLSA